METIIQVEIKNVYGVNTVYPVNDRAKMFVSLLRKKTFNIFDIETLKRLGYSFEVVQPLQTV